MNGIQVMNYQYFKKTKKMLKKTIYLLFLLALAFNCAQKKDNNQKTKNSMSKVLEKLQNFDKEPNYKLKIASNLSYEIRINGIPVAYKNENINTDRWFLINNSIPESGEQTLEIFIYPSMEQNGTVHKKALEKKPFSLVIEKDFWEESGILSPSEEIFSFSLSDNVDYVDKEFYYSKTKFTAEVPYKLNNWKNGKIFNEKDSTVIKSKILQKYSLQKEHYENKEGEEYINMLDKGLFNLLQGGYFSKTDANKYITDKINFINKKERKLADLENYKLVFSGDNKLVSLRRIDGYNMNEGVLRRYYTNNGQEKVHIDDIIFYSPLENNSDELQVIFYLNIIKGAKP